MPRLLVFAPCRRVIIAAGENTPSLIDLLQDINVGVKEPLPENALAPLQWSSFALWLKQAEDIGKTYTQRVELISPSGKSVMEVITDFEMDKTTHRIINTIPGFPVSEQGEYVLRLWLSEATKQEWREISAYPLKIIHRQPVEKDEAVKLP